MSNELDEPMSNMTDRQAALSLCNVSRETEECLDRLVAMLPRWQKVKNLVATSTLQHVWMRHIADSLQLVELAGDVVARKTSGIHSVSNTKPPLRWLDLGSGGGFPGLVVAAALANIGDCDIILVESNSRKCAFLREAAREMDLRNKGVNVKVVAARIEDFLNADPSRGVVTLDAASVDVVSARALAALPQLVEWTHKLLTKGAVALFPKGKDLTSELTETAKCWRLEYTIHNSLTDQTGRILKMTVAFPL